MFGVAIAFGVAMAFGMALVMESVMSQFTSESCRGLRQSHVAAYVVVKSQDYIANLYKNLHTKIIHQTFVKICWVCWSSYRLYWSSGSSSHPRPDIHVGFSMEGELWENDENCISMEGVCWRPTTHAAPSIIETCMTKNY